MDLRTGVMYPTKADALSAGVPESDIAEIVGDPLDIHRDAGKIVRFSAGPFKDRTYRRTNNGQIVRVK